MELGWLDVCLRVADVEVSRPFYEGLCFHRVEGDDAEGWAIMVQGESRVGLFEARYMDDPFTLNFRGGDIPRVTEELKVKGYVFAKETAIGEQGGGSARLRDPDGHPIFLDCAPGEIKRN